MARAIWSGTVGFGLVNVPVKLYGATSEKTVRFNQLNKETGHRIKQQRVDSETGTEVPFENIVKGYELSPDRYVLIEPEELESLAPSKTRSIAIDGFTDLDQINPLIYDSSYYLAPDTGANKAYRLLADAMEATGKVAIGKLVLRSKEKLVFVRAQEGRLVVSTAIWADEVNAMPEFEQAEVQDAERQMAEKLVNSMSSDFDHTQYEDTYREQVLSLIERKAAGEVIEMPTADAAPEPTGDLMAALAASLEASNVSA
jgi:DNA end-binding protein Ku